MRQRMIVILWLVMTAALAACNLPRRAGPGSAESSPPSPSSVMASPTPSAEPAPPPTPTPNTPTRLLLLALPGSDMAQATALQPALQELAQANGLTLETRTDLPQAELQSQARWVVVLPPDPGVANLAKANPQAQFLALGMPELKAGGNISVIAGGDSFADQQGFIAGYMAAMLTNDWRVGVISRADNPPGLAARNGFINGTIFYCGLCRPAAPPYVQYPVFAEVSAAAAAAELQSAADTLLSNAVQTVYLAPGISDESVLAYLAQKGVKIIGAAAPASSVAAQWVASLRSDPGAAIQDVAARWLKGETAVQLAAPLALSDVNPNLLSPGRQRLANEVLAELLSGGIDTGVDPQTGQMKK